MSPKILSLPESFLQKYNVIGLNGAPGVPHVRPFLDHWLVWDTLRLLDERADLLPLAPASRWWRYQPRALSRMPEGYPVQWFRGVTRIAPWDDSRPPPPVNPRGSMLPLCMVKTAATAAIHLAFYLGASEIVLAGVDLMGDSRADGTRADKPYQRTVNHVQAFLRNFPIPVKTIHPESPLSLPVLKIQ